MPDEPKYERQSTIGNVAYAIEQAQALANSFNQKYVVVIDGRVIPQHIFDALQVKPKIAEIVYPIKD